MSYLIKIQLRTLLARPDRKFIRKRMRIDRINEQKELFYCFRLKVPVMKSRKNQRQCTIYIFLYVANMKPLTTQVNIFLILKFWEKKTKQTKTAVFYSITFHLDYLSLHFKEVPPKSKARTCKILEILLTSTGVPLNMEKYEKALHYLKF
jgi:hypothetical protein